MESQENCSDFEIGSLFETLGFQTPIREEVFGPQEPTQKTSQQLFGRLLGCTRKLVNG